MNFICFHKPTTEEVGDSCESGRTCSPLQSKTKDCLHLEFLTLLAITFRMPRLGERQKIER